MFEFVSKVIPKKVVTLSQEEKYLVEEYLDDGRKPKEISEELRLDYGSVFRHYTTWAKRKERANNNNQITNQSSQQINSVSKELEEEKIKHQLEILKENNKLDLELKKLEVERLKRDLYDGEEQPSQVETMLTSIFTPLIQQTLSKKFEHTKNTPSTKLPGNENPPGNEVETFRNYSEDEIKSMINQTPKELLKVAKKLEYDKLFQIIVGQIPDASDESIERAIVMIKDEK